MADRMLLPFLIEFSTQYGDPAKFKTGSSDFGHLRTSQCAYSVVPGYFEFNLLEFAVHGGRVFAWQTFLLLFRKK